MKNLAPNGKPSNLTPEQYRLVRTPAFKKWFGDWEKKPKTASKVVDSNGEPLVVYHGSNDIITEFNSDYSYYGEFWFSRNKEKILKGESGASGIKYILPCFLNIKKMAGWNEYQNLYTDQRIQMGYDGTNIDEDYIAYEPNQIKLADGTNTTFDGSNPDIRFSDGGLIAPNGKKSNLTPEQYRLVRTTEFKAWFGDWEKSREEALKNIVNSNYNIALPYTTKGINEKFFRGVSKVMGKEPKIVWHGSNEEYNIFDNKKGLPYFYFTDKKQVAKLYGNIVKPYYLNIKNPIFFYADCSNFNDLGKKTSIVHKLMNALIDAKKFNSKQYVYYYENEYVIEPENDGIIIKDIVDSNVEDMLDEDNQEKIYNYYCSDFFIVPESNQIKLADGTNTTFDSNNPDIRYADGGLTNDEIEKTEKAILNFLKKQELIDDEPLRSYGDMNIGDTINVTDVNYDLPESQATPDEGIYKLMVVPISKTDHFIRGAVNRNAFAFDDYDGWQTENLNKIKKTFDSERREPIIVSEGEDGLLNVIDGHHRITIADELGRKSILALVREFKNNSIPSDWNDSVNKISKRYKKIKSILSNIPNPEIKDINFVNKIDEILNAKYSDGGLIETLTTEQVEQKLGRKLHWWNDDVVLIKGVRYKKVFLRPEYQVILS
jgi:hypothetical protein